MSVLGITLLLGGGVLLFLSYKKYLSFSERECRGYLSLIEFLHSRVSCYLSPVDEVIREFRSDVLVECGFLDAATEGSLKDAFLKVREASRMPSDAIVAVEEFLSGLGKGYLDSEVRAMEIAIKKLRRICDRECAERANRVKIAGALIFAVTVGTLLLLV